MSKAQRIQEIIDYYGMSYNSFAISLGMLNGTSIKRIVDDNRNPQNQTLQKISQAYPEINMNWLNTGTGEMIKGDAINIREDDLTVTAKQILKKLEEDRVYYDSVRNEMNTIKFKELFDNFESLEGRVESYAIQASQTVNDKLDQLSKNYNDSFLVALDKILRIEQDLENINTFMAQAFETEQIQAKLKSKLKTNPNERT
jgi:hypothetical protein